MNYIIQAPKNAIELNREYGKTLSQKDTINSVIEELRRKYEEGTIDIARYLSLLKKYKNELAELDWKATEQKNSLLEEINSH